MGQQLPLGLDAQPPPSLDGFIGAENLLLRALIAQQMAGRGETQLLIHGTTALGKTHLAEAACFYAATQGRRAGFISLRHNAPPDLAFDALDALVLDDIHCLAGQPQREFWLFDVINQVRERGLSLLMTSSLAPAEMAFNLPDLASRLVWGPVLRLAAPNEAEKLELLMRKAAERGLSLPFDAAMYVLNHGARDVGSLVDTINRLDVASFAAQRKLSLAFVRGVLFSAPVKPPD